MGIVVDALLGVGDADRAKQFDGAGASVGFRREAVHDQRLGDVGADAHHRIERGHRFLKDETDSGAADLAHLGFGERQQLFALEDRRGRLRCGRAFPAAG